MKEQTKRGGWGKRTENFTVRFDKKQFEVLKAKENLSTAQQVVDYLLTRYEQSALIENPTMARNMVFQKSGGGIIGVQDLTNPNPVAPKVIDTTKPKGNDYLAQRRNLKNKTK